MKFIKINNLKEAKQLLLKEIRAATDKYKSVAWFFSGGSNIDLTAYVVNKLDPASLAKITLLPADERYGNPGHADSNYTKLERAGVDFARVKNYSVLGASYKSLEQAADNYEKIVESVLNSSDYSIDQLGIGDDGHTSGILPNSPAVNETDKLVTGYIGFDFQRVTTTFRALKMFSKTLVFSFGEDKRQTLMNLHDEKLSLAEQPSQIFRQLPDVYIINDIIGDKL